MIYFKDKFGLKWKTVKKIEKFSLFFLTFSVKSFIITHKNVNDNIFQELL